MKILSIYLFIYLKKNIQNNRKLNRTLNLETHYVEESTCSCLRFKCEFNATCEEYLFSQSL